jgi:hypothetical protein
LEVTLSVDGGAAPGGAVTCSAAADSSTLITIDDTDAHIVAGTGEGNVHVVVVQGAPTSVATIDCVGTDNDPGDSITDHVSINITRAPRLSSISFDSVTPDTSLGVAGGALPTTAVLHWTVRDDSGNPLPNVNVRFARDSTSDAQLAVSPSATSDNGGGVTTVISTGTIPGPVRVVATAPISSTETLTQFSPNIVIVDGLPSFEKSFFTCGNGNVARTAPWVVTCTAQLVDRVSNTVDGELVQFFTEAGNQPAAQVSDGGAATVTVASDLTFNPGADVSSWSLGAVLPLSAGDLTVPGGTFTAADAAACFDGKSNTPCDLIKLCSDPNLDVFCPLTPDCVTPEVTASVGFLRSPPTPAQAVGSRAGDIAEYLAADRQCGFPISCLVGLPDGMGLSATAGDECPINIGCFDFTGKTECPQDGLRTFTAVTRGAEPFGDLNGNNKFDFDDTNHDGVHEATEAHNEPFVDMPEPFLDVNDNCTPDDLSTAVRYEHQVIVGIANTDKTQDVDHNGKFGFDRLDLTPVGAPTVVTRTNGAWDFDTPMMLSTHILELGGAALSVGESCTDAEVDTNNHLCQNGGHAICRETTGGDFADCAPPDLNATGSAVVSFRWADGNGNCPSVDMASVANVASDGPIVIAGATSVTLDSASCGYGDVHNEQQPECVEMPSLRSPILDVQVIAKCTAATDSGPAKLTFTLDDATESVSFFVDCS